MKFHQQAEETRKKETMKKQTIKISLVLIVITLAVVLYAGVSHLGFTGELRKSIYWINQSFLDLTYSVAIWLLLKGKAPKMLGFALVIYNFSYFVMEILAANGFKELVTKINSYNYAQYLFIILAVVLSLIGYYLAHGIHNSGLNEPRNILELLRRSGGKGKETKSTYR